MNIINFFLWIHPFFYNVCHDLYHPRHHLPEIYGPYHISRMKRVKSIQAIFCLDQTYANMRSPADLQKRLASKRVYAAIWIFVLINCDPNFPILNYRTFLLVVELKLRPCENSQVDFCKIEKILKGSLDSIPSPSMKIQIMGGKFCTRCKGKTLLGIVNKVFKPKKCWHQPAMFCFITSFPPMIWFFTDGEGDGMKSS